MARTLARIAGVGLLCALIVAAGGQMLRRVMLGADDRDARERITREVREAFDVLASDLQRLTERAGSPSDVQLAAGGDDPAAERLFESAAAAVGAREDFDAALTTYASDGRALAWAGRPTQIGDRLQGPEGWMLLPAGEMDLQLVYIAPIDDGDVRVGAAVAERPLQLRGGGVQSTECGSRESYCFSTRLGPVTIELPHATDRADDDAAGDRFEIRSPSGVLLSTAVARPADRMLAYERWQKATRSLLLVVLAVTVLCLVAPLLDARNRARNPARFVALTLGAGGLVVAARLILSLAAFADWTDARLFSSATYASYLGRHEGVTSTELLLNRLLLSPFEFLMTALAVAALAALCTTGVEQWRLYARRGRLPVDTPGRYAGFTAVQLAAGSLLAVLLLAYQALIRDTIENTTLDLVHFSLQPWDPSRTALEIGLLIGGVAVAVLAVLTLRAAMVRWRPRRARGWRLRMLAIACWGAPLLIWQTWRPDSDQQRLPLLVAAGVVMATASVATHLKAQYRHGSQAFRLTVLALVLVVPPFAFYPTLFHEAGHVKAQQVETRYTDQVLNQRQTLQTQLDQSLDEIDAMELDQLDPTDSPANTFSEPTGEASTERAFRVWQRTALSNYPITSSIELYDADGRLTSRFAFNLPEDLTATPRSEEQECGWLKYGEVAAFFAEERPVLHAGRRMCRNGRPDPRQGSIVVHAMLDYENLPFISSRTPYRRPFRPGEASPAPIGTTRPGDGTPDSLTEGDVEFAFYGWSFTPLYPSNQPAWRLEGEVRARLENDPSHSPFWRKLRRGGEQFDVYLLSDRTGIYALGFPVVTPLGHLVNLAELTVLSALCYIILLALSGTVTALTRRTVHAPALLREIRASFYRKLFLAFVAAVIFPVAALALVTRNYVVREMRATVDQEAVRTASSARRVVEDLVTQLSVGLDDNLMVWVSRLIDQDVNVFEGSRLVATSERNLFASGSLPTRAPADIFWALQLRHEAAAVTRERVASAEDYLVAATPLTAPQPGTMLTVPLTTGQREIEIRIATLNRYMLLGALMFILVGAGLGYSMAERISDPVNRLTRATRRISRGDLDARIVARSSDELRRLVDDFNSMAAELQRQQKALQQTHRLEAWAEMARQVAHDIKNPLTPIQLTAEHLRRVHADRGEPLSPVLQECVATILTQVRLLRQIASEFSSFASSPIAKPAVVDVTELVREILQPYRVGLQDRIRFAVDVPDVLPVIHVDRALMTRGLTNILENALHAMPGSGTLTLVAEAAGNAVRLRVSDSGSGMDAEALARAFEPYFSTKAGGTGLGLPIAKRNIELNGGTIAISSERERGTTVTITVPAYTAGT